MQLLLFMTIRRNIEITLHCKTGIKRVFNFGVQWV